MLNQKQLKWILIIGLILSVNPLFLIGKTTRQATSDGNPGVPYENQAQSTPRHQAQSTQPHSRQPSAQHSQLPPNGQSTPQGNSQNSSQLVQGNGGERAAQTNGHFRANLTDQDQRGYRWLGRIFGSIAEFAAAAAQGEEGLRRALAMPMEGFEKNYIHNFRRGLSWPTRVVRGEIDLNQDQVVMVEGQIRAIIRNFAYRHMQRKKLLEGLRHVEGQEPRDEDVDWYLDDERRQGIAKMEVYIVLTTDEVKVIRTLWEHGPVFGPGADTALVRFEEDDEDIDRVEEDLAWYPRMQWVDYTYLNTQRIVEGDHMDRNEQGNLTAPLTRIVTFRRPNGSIYEDIRGHTIELIIVIVRTRHEINQDDRDRDPAFAGYDTHGRTLESIRYDYIDPIDGDRIEWETRENQERPHLCRALNNGWQWYYIDANDREQVISQISVAHSSRNEGYVEMVDQEKVIPARKIVISADSWNWLPEEDRLKLAKQGAKGDNWRVNKDGSLSYELIKGRRSIPFIGRRKRYAPDIRATIKAETIHVEVPTERQRTVNQTSRTANCIVDQAKNASWTQ